VKPVSSDDAGDRGGDEAVQVGQDVLEGALEFRLDRLALLIAHAAAMLTTMPTRR